MANLDFTGVDPADYINATLIRNDIAFRAHPNGMWYRYVEPVTGGGTTITVTSGIASATVSGTLYFWPVFETNPNA